MNVPPRIIHFAFSTIIFCCFLAIAPARADEQRRPVTPENIARIKRRLEESRELKFKSEVVTVFLDAAGMADVTGKLMARQGMDAAHVAVYAKILAAFGFLPEGYDLAAALKSLIEEQVQGIYDPDTRTLYVRDDMVFPELPGGEMSGIDESEIALSHELAHALQDQHFDLSRVISLRADDEDRAFALNALVEGDATIAMLNYGMSGMGFEVPDAPLFAGFMESFLFNKSDGVFSTLTSLPPVIKVQFLSSYTEGMKFVAKLYREGGWPLVNFAIANPPESSEQILHPHKFFDGRDNPVLITLPALDKFAAPGAKLLEENVVGELMIRVLLEQRNIKDAKDHASRAAAGWDGDRFAFLENPDGKMSMFWLTTWDSPAEASEFFDSFSGALAERFGSTGSRGDGGAFVWNNASCGSAALALRNNDVAFIYCPGGGAISDVATAMFSSTRKQIESRPPDMSLFSQ